MQLPQIWDGLKKGDIINRQLCHFFRVDIGLGNRPGFGVNPEERCKEAAPIA